MAVETLSHSKPAYPFLCRPPPQNARPMQALPMSAACAPRRRSYTAIQAWAAHVQPGSPGSPHARRASFGRRVSGSGRMTPSPRSASASFVLVDSPVPAAKEVVMDLTQLGYTSVFVHLPTTPAQCPETKRSQPTVAIDTLPKPSTRTLKSFRSFGMLRPRARSGSALDLPPSPMKLTTKNSSGLLATDESSKILASSVAARKKAVYPQAKPSKAVVKDPKPKAKRTPLPPSLAAELALMQFVDGGSMDDNIKRLMEEQARAAAPKGTKSGNLVVADVYRAHNGVWLDRDEEMEYAHLLGGKAPSDSDAKWVSFGEDGTKNDEDELAIASLATVTQRESNISTNTNTSSLDPSNVVKPADEDGTVISIPLHSLTPPVPTLAPAPTSTKETRRASPPLLALPSRPCRQHYGNPAFFLLDLDTFSVPQTPKTPKTPHAPFTPSHSHVRRPSLVKRASPTHAVFPAPSQRPARRRRPVPAPIKIVPQRSAREVERDGEDLVLALASPAAGVLPRPKPVFVAPSDPREARQDFLDNSFAPRPAPVPPLPATALLPVVEPLRVVQGPTLKKQSKFRLIFGRK